MGFQISQKPHLSHDEVLIVSINGVGGGLWVDRIYARG